jgi:DmsE family decaheme c-type cytochrome
MHSRRWKMQGIALWGTTIWLVAIGPATADQGKQAAAPAAGYAGQDTCLMCHSDMGKVYQATPHGWAKNPRSPAATHGCESCHGPGKAHADAGGDKTKIRSFENLKPAEINATCDTCHNRGTHADWVGSMHDRHNLSCTTCHSIHAFKSETSQLKAVSVIDTCARCHRTESLKIMKVAHMPLREGKMACSSCHNPHGSSNVRLLRVGHSIAESCTSCHAAQRGPFLWEHAPTRERCTTCHDPHGSSNDRLLVARPPMLCQRCHVSTRHPSTIYDYSYIATKSGSENRLVNRGCVNCHQNIHGSNHPSGNFFLR